MMTEIVVTLTNDRVRVFRSKYYTWTDGFNFIRLTPTALGEAEGCWMFRFPWANILSIKEIK
jgi:hypothetical protein